jgi:hypothetical protein
LRSVYRTGGGGNRLLDFGYGLINDLISIASRDEKIDEPKLNFMLSIVKGIKPNDQLEAMLAAQMAAVHVTAMKFVGEISRIDAFGTVPLLSQGGRYAPADCE